MMYIYHALINALGAPMIHIILNIPYTCRAQSYQNNLRKVLYAHTHTHTHYLANDAVRFACYTSFWVNIHFRCRAWQAQIIDVIHSDLLLEHPCNVRKVIACENASLLASSIVFSSFTVSNCSARCYISHFEPVRRETIHLNNAGAMWML